MCPYLYTIKFDGNGAAKGKMSEKACAAGQKEKLSKISLKRKDIHLQAGIRSQMGREPFMRKMPM